MLVRLLVPLGLVFALGACNTLQGVGEDIGVAGQTVQQEAQRTQ
jgi:predicted small secreted protein